MTISLQRREERVHAQARRALLESELSRWLPLLIAHEQPDKIILFGSYCAGQVSEWSDLDLASLADRCRFLCKKLSATCLDLTGLVMKTCQV